MIPSPKNNSNWREFKQKNETLINLENRAEHTENRDENEILINLEQSKIPIRLIIK